jgi:MFS family permease
LSELVRPGYILPTIVLAQFAGVSVWFAGNAILPDLQRDWHLSEQSLGSVTVAVQLGFVVGTLLFAVIAIADRYSPVRVFFSCAIIAALANGSLLVAPETYESLLTLRFITGFFLAGIYPVGMKIAASWHKTGLGRGLGYLVGALVVGTAFPHLLKGIGAEIAWQNVIAGVSILTASGAVMILWIVPDGPYVPSGARFNPFVIGLILKSKKFRASCLGYFGHMWELYAFWAFVPMWLLASTNASDTTLNISLWSFFIIAIGSVGCIVGGIYSVRLGSARVASVQLFVSGCCCVLSPLLFGTNTVVVLVFLMIWGVTVIGDSPQLSALNAENAPPEYIGSALTFANSIGFLITIGSIYGINYLLPIIGPKYIFWILVPGPIIGFLALRTLRSQSTS